MSNEIIGLEDKVYSAYWAAKADDDWAAFDAAEAELNAAQRAAGTEQTAMH